jgi:hypothetical protein
MPNAENKQLSNQLQRLLLDSAKLEQLILNNATCSYLPHIFLEVRSFHACAPRIFQGTQNGEWRLGDWGGRSAGHKLPCPLQANGQW